MAFFDNICTEVTNASSLGQYLEYNIGDFWSFYYSEHAQLLRYADEVERFVLSKSQCLSHLDFSRGENKSFVAALLDVCLRINRSSPVSPLYRIINDIGIQINSRIEAGLSFVYPTRPANAEQMINLCDNICQKLQYAIDNEEDNDTKSLITFLCYYSAALDSLHQTQVVRLKRKVELLMDAGSYPFLGNVIALRGIDVTACDAYDRVQQIIDGYYNDGNRRNLSIENVPNYLIEENTDYSFCLRSLSNCNFDAIRRIAVQNASREPLQGRGVNILETEEQLYTYLKSYGNMHKAKMLSAMDAPFPQRFDGPINIIDWGCGQALATMVFVDKYGNNCVSNITLIEPSLLAIKRASLHCNCMAPNAGIKTVNKILDDVRLEDIESVDNNTTIHLFSNILDIDDYNVQRLGNLLDTYTAQTNYYVCVSPYIDDIRAGKVESFVTHFRNRPGFEMLSNNTNTRSGPFWMCNNVYNNPGMQHGANAFCGSNMGLNGCERRWTRISHVFKA